LEEPIQLPGTHNCECLLLISSEQNCSCRAPVGAFHYVYQHISLQNEDFFVTL